MTTSRRDVVTGFGAAFLLGLLSGCDGTDGRFTDRPQLLPTPVGVGTKLLLVDRNTALLLDAGSANPVPLRAPVLPNPTAVVARAQHAEQALILSAGVSGDGNALQVAGGLTLVSEDGTARTFPLGNNPFDVLKQQPAGRYVALLRSGVTTQLLQNANEMALVDLESEDSAGSAAAVRLVTLPEAPRAVFFSDTFTLDGEDRPLALALTDNTAALFDLANPDAVPVLIQLNTEPMRPLYPRDVLFDAPNSKLYIRSAAADDIFSLRIVGREPSPNLAAFAVSIDIVAAGRGPSDMQLFEIDGINYLLVMAAGSNSAVLVDVSTSRTTSVRLPRSFDQARVHYTTDAAGVRTPHALLWDTESGALASLTLSFSAAALDRSLTALPNLPSSVVDAVPWTNGTVAFVGSEQHITLVDPAAGSVTPYNSRERIVSGLLDEKRSLLWLAPSQQRRIAYLDLTSGATDDLLLDQEVQVATLVPGAARLAVVHDDELGHVTFVDLDAPSRSSSVGVRGFLAKGLFE